MLALTLGVETLGPPGACRPVTLSQVEEEPEMTPDPERAAVIGVDFGTLSGRALVARVNDGAELGWAVHDYRHGVIERSLPGSQRSLPPDFALQVPADYVDVLRNAVPQAIENAGVAPCDIVGIATDFTACTMVPVTADGVPLCEQSRFADRPHAYVKLWKHHAAQPQADRVNELARRRGESWLPRYGGLISSEWEFAKGLQILEEDPEIYAAMDSFVEAADWIVWQLTGSYVRNACSAGYKGILQDGAYPSADFCAALNPGFAGFVDAKLAAPIGQLGSVAGTLSAVAATWTGLPAGIPVAVGNVDAHVTAPAADAVGDGQLVAIMGTSTCHVMNGSALTEVPGMCGVVLGGITAGQFGYEAGQSGVGDIFGWWVDNAVPPDCRDRRRCRGICARLPVRPGPPAGVGQHGLLALDWESGNRSVLVDHELSGVIVGLTLLSRPEEVYRALVEATAFGTRTIVDAFNASGVPVTEFVAAGGLIRNDFVMQVYADVLGMPLSVMTTVQGPALGSAIHAAVAAGYYLDVPRAAAAMGRRAVAAFVPDPAAHAAYDEIYAEYRLLHDYFGRGGNDVMHRLKAIQRRAVAASGASAVSP